MDQIPSNQKHLTVIQVKFTTLTLKLCRDVLYCQTQHKKKQKKKNAPKTKGLKVIDSNNI